MTSIAIETARPDDDAALSALAETLPSEGAMRLRLSTPSYFAASAVHGPRHQAYVTRDQGTGQIVGVAAVSEKPGLINGAPAAIGYIGNLRLLPAYRRGLVFGRALRWYQQLRAARPTTPTPTEGPAAGGEQGPPGRPPPGTSSAPDSAVAQGCGDQPASPAQLGSARLFLTTIMEDNHPARRLLTSGRAGLPTYHDAGRITTHVYATARDPWRTGRGCRPAPPPSPASGRAAAEHPIVRTATAADLQALERFWAEQGRRRQFFPGYRALDLLGGLPARPGDDAAEQRLPGAAPVLAGQAGHRNPASLPGAATDHPDNNKRPAASLLPGLRPEHVWLAEDGEGIAATAALWDQSQLRRWVVDGYATWLSLVRRPYNLWAGLTGRPTLPPAGQELPYLFVAVLLARRPALLPPLLSACWRDPRVQPGRHLIVAGVHERDEFAPLLARPAAYRLHSRLYVVHWEDGAASYAGLDDRPPYVELGSL